MKRLIPFGIAALFALPLAGTVFAKEAKETREGAKSTTTKTKAAEEKPTTKPDGKTTRKNIKNYGGYAQIAADMTPEQLAKLDSLIDEKKAAMAEFDAKHASRKAEIEKSLAETTDKTERAAKQKELNILRQQRTSLDKDYKDKIEAILTPEQKAKWAGLGIYSGMTRTFNAAKLTEAQKDEIKKKCLEAGARFNAADAKQQEEIKKSIRASVESDVLTAEQRELLKKEADEAAAKRAAAHSAAKTAKAESKQEDAQTKKQAKAAEKAAEKAAKNSAKEKSE